MTTEKAPADCDFARNDAGRREGHTIKPDINNWETSA